MIFALRLFTFAALVALFPIGGDAASLLGHSRLFTNDALGDSKDRWRTASYSSTLVFGETWGGQLPDGPFDLYSFHIRTEIVAPEKLNGQFNPSDRRYVGAITLGAATHFDWRGIDTTLGAELTFTGPQTGLGDFHSSFHELLSIQPPSASVLANQIGDAVYPSLYAEFRTHGLKTTRGQFYPFAQLQAGVESYARLGIDYIAGPVREGVFFVRDTPTGHLVPTLKSTRPKGLSFLAGVDIAAIADSAYFPDLAYERIRKRVRIGAYYDTGNWSVFYGATYLSPEFKNQTEGQIVGSVHVRFLF